MTSAESPQPEMPARNNVRLFLFAANLLLACFFVFFALKPLAYSWSAISAYPYQIDREEGFVLNQALQLRHGKTIYPDLKDYPYTMGAYTPLYPLVYAGALLVAEPGLPPGRAIVLACVLATAAMMAWLVYRETGFLPAAIIAPAIFLTTYEVNDWIAYARVDFPALMLGLAGFAMAGRGRRRVWIPAAAALFVAAFYTKQTQLLAPAAVLAGLLIARRWRDAALFAGITAGAALVIGLLLIAVTRGQFWIHTVVYNANDFHFRDVLAMSRHVRRFQHWTLLAMAVAGVALVAGIFRERGSGEYSFRAALVVYTLLAVASIVGIGKAGSAVNYLLEMDMTIALLLAVGLGDGVKRAGSWKRPAAAVLITIFLAAHAVWMAKPFYRNVAFHPPRTEAERVPMDSLALRVIGTRGDILSEDPLLNIMAGKDVLFQPFIMSQLAREGKWDATQFIRDIRDRRFSIIVTLEDLQRDYAAGFTEEMRDTILENYDVEGLVGESRGLDRYTYQPKTRKNP